MDAFVNRKVTLKMPLVLNLCLKLCVALVLINFALNAGAISARKFNLASRNDLITGNNPHGLYQQGDDRTYSAGDSSKDSDLVVLPQANSDLYGELECSPKEDLEYTVDSQYLPSGMPIFRITFTNTCLNCNIYNIHIGCGDFSTPMWVNPAIFRKLSSGDCLINNGGPLDPQNAIAFEYESTFAYPMTVGVASVSFQ